MRKFSFLVVTLLMILSCNSDDDNTVAACSKATNVQVSDITANSATINWNDPNNASTYFVEFGVAGFAIGSGTTQIETTRSTTLDNLQPSTTYDVYVQVVCSTNNLSMYTDVFSFTTASLPVVPEFRQNLSELNLYTGLMPNLEPSDQTFEYNLNSQLFTDYAHKQRIIALPEGTKMTFDGDLLPIFPDNTVIAKTFFYNNNETDLSQGRRIIETRVLIKIDGSWETGDYRWNETQSDAVLDLNGGPVPVTWVDENGETNNITYQIPSNTDCFTCHQLNNNGTPIGPKMRNLNFMINGTNQLQNLIDNNLLEGLTDPSTVNVLPRWDDTANYTLEERARGYIDINCAHCHIEGTYCEDQSQLRLDLERSLDDSRIVNRKNSMISRISNYNQGFSMPFIGTTIVHEEGVEVLLEYLNTL